ncbi:hypothetical protein CLCAR_2229 [Clostridium carboxidivorans P7]|nr:hypothetical protein CLCAR_2229 [Clostridium carboxidivorans P7]
MHFSKEDSSYTFFIDLPPHIRYKPNSLKFQKVLNIIVLFFSHFI